MWKSILGLILVKFSLSAKYNYTISSTWDNQTIEQSAQIHISLSIKTESGTFNKGLLILVNAPFYNDPLAPDVSTDEPLMGLWDYEVVELFFLGDGDEYLQMELSPSGHYATLYFKGYRNNTGRYMPLNGVLTSVYNQNGTTFAPTKGRWTGQAVIPGDYFPCNVTKFNAHAIHKSGSERRFTSLFPITDGEILVPDFHYLKPFGNIQLDNQLNNHCNNENTNTASALSIPNVSVLFAFVSAIIKF